MPNTRGNVGPVVPLRPAHSVSHALFLLYMNCICFSIFTNFVFVTVGRDSGVGMASHYRLDSLGIKSW